MKINTTMMAALAALGMAVPAQALTLGGPLPAFRTASLDTATSGATGSGNATVTDVNAAFPLLAPWTERGSVAGGDGNSGEIVDGSLTVDVTSGTWGSKMVSGTWTINDPLFWTSYASGAISLHVGNGGGEPDHFIWLLGDGETSGTWSYDGTGLGGGGLSNLKLYSSGTGTNVPDGGATVALFGLSLLGLSLGRRFKRA